MDKNDKTANNPTTSGDGLDDDGNTCFWGASRIIDYSADKNINGERFYCAERKARKTFFKKLNDEIDNGTFWSQVDSKSINLQVALLGLLSADPRYFNAKINDYVAELRQLIQVPKRNTRSELKQAILQQYQEPLLTWQQELKTLLLEYSEENKEMNMLFYPVFAALEDHTIIVFNDDGTLNTNVSSISGKIFHELKDLTITLGGLPKDKRKDISYVCAEQGHFSALNIKKTQFATNKKLTNVLHSAKMYNNEINDIQESKSTTKNNKGNAKKPAKESQLAEDKELAEKLWEKEQWQFDKDEELAKILQEEEEKQLKEDQRLARTLQEEEEKEFAGQKGNKAQTVAEREANRIINQGETAIKQGGKGITGLGKGIRKMFGTLQEEEKELVNQKGNKNQAVVEREANRIINQGETAIKQGGKGITGLGKGIRKMFRK